MSVADEMREYLQQRSDEAHEALQVGGYEPLDDDLPAVGITYGHIRRWLAMLEELGE